MSIRTLQWPVPRPSDLRALIAGIALSLPLTAIAEAEERLGVELNKLEPIDSGCRIYLVFENALGTKLEALELELILFDTEGFIKGRLTLDAAPIDADKTSVRLFDLAQIECEQVGRILVNDVLAMAGPDGALPNEVSRLDLSSKLEVDLFK